jgi:hypothetical protein
MSFFDKIKDKLIPDASSAPISTSASGGIGGGRGAMGFEDDVSPRLLFSRDLLRIATALFSNPLKPFT